MKESSKTTKRMVKGYMFTLMAQNTLAHSVMNSKMEKPNFTMPMGHISRGFSRMEKRMD